MANKKRMTERREAERQARQTRNIQKTGGVVVLLILIWLGYTILNSRGPKQYTSPPPMTIDVTTQYFATFIMENGGEFVIQLYADKTPNTVNNFIFLAREGFYDGVIFHRVIEGFMAQGGDPTGTGTGGPGYSFADEFDSSLTFDRPGLLAMANSGPNTNGSQFFITFAPTEWLNNKHTIFGEVIEGMDVVNVITRTEPGTGIPADAIETITITEE